MTTNVYWIAELLPLDSLQVSSWTVVQMKAELCMSRLSLYKVPKYAQVKARSYSYLMYQNCYNQAGEFTINKYVLVDTLVRIYICLLLERKDLNITNFRAGVQSKRAMARFEMFRMQLNSGWEKMYEWERVEWVSEWVREWLGEWMSEWMKSIAVKRIVWYNRMGQSGVNSQIHIYSI